MSSIGVPREIALFPLGSVLFPGGLLELRIFESRYLDLMSRCLREQTPFGVVALQSGGETRQGDQPVTLHDLGTLAEIIELDSVQTGILQVSARGTHRFSLSSPRQLADGLWVGDILELPDDVPVAPGPSHARIVGGLAEAIETLASNGIHPFAEPMRLDDAGWVADRWCEILPFPVEAKLGLLATFDPLARLDVIDAFLNSGRPSH